MLRLRPYQDTDADVILSWPMDEKAFYQWTAGRLGGYPLSGDRFARLDSLMRFTLLDETEPAGFFTLRNPNGTPEVVRFEIYGARKATLGVFENNPAAYYCYKAAGFRNAPAEGPETYRVLGENWQCLELIAEKEDKA